jgi:general secretion pathway protein K
MKKIFLIMFLTILLTSCKEDSGIEFGKNTETEVEEVISESVTKESISEAVTAEEYIDVFISGCVNKPDVYKLKKDSIIKDAVEMAGGFSEDACRDYVNLAKKIESGEHIIIPSQDEVKDLNPIQVEDALNSSSLVNINKASKEELMSLPGIGERKAEAIIKYRNSKSFSNIEDIMNISGIKEAAFNKIKDKICIN